jgi:hypothetical protein
MTHMTGWDLFIDIGREINTGCYDGAGRPWYLVPRNEAVTKPEQTNTNYALQHAITHNTL